MSIILNIMGMLFIILLFLVIFYLYLIIRNYKITTISGHLFSKDTIIKIILVGIGLSIILVLYYSVTRLGEITYHLIISIGIAYLLNPIVRFLCKKGMKRFWSVLTVFLFFFLTLGLLLAYLVPIISQEILVLAKDMPQYIERLNNLANTILIEYRSNIELLPEAVKEVINKNLLFVQDRVLNIIANLTQRVMGLFSTIIGLVTIPILTFYFLKDTPLIRQRLVIALPKKYRTQIVGIARDIDGVLGNYIRGLLIVSTFVGLMSTAGFLVIGINFAVIAGLICGVTNIIPYFGPFIGAVPAALFAALGGGQKIIVTVLWLFVVQQIESSIISPKIVGKSVGMHPAVVIIVLLTGGKLFGIVGLILAVPVTAILKVILKHGVSSFLGI